MTLYKKIESELTSDNPADCVPGEIIEMGLAGVSLYQISKCDDDRGRLFEITNPRWNWGGGFSYSHLFTLKPGVAKGWAMHRESDDHYVMIVGKVTVALFDGREQSSTYEKIIDLVLSADRPASLHIPAGVWHATGNYESSEAILINSPSKLYSYEKPDKCRLPLDNAFIKYEFSGLKGY